LVRRTGKYLQHLKLLTYPGLSISNLFFLSVKLQYLHLDDDRKALIRVVSAANIALRRLNLTYDSLVYYRHHLPTYIRCTQVKEITIPFSTWAEGMRDEWLTLDEMIASALIAFPRPNFVLRVYMPSMPKLVSEECVRCSLPRCIALEVLDFVYYVSLVL